MLMNKLNHYSWLALVLFLLCWLSDSHNVFDYYCDRYGKEIYQHANHWRKLGGTSGWNFYTAGQFAECSEPGHHACLDQYIADGNLHLGKPFVWESAATDFWSVQTFVTYFQKKVTHWNSDVSIDAQIRVIDRYLLDCHRLFSIIYQH
mgnify:CR=1 FL=1